MAVKPILGSYPYLTLAKKYGIRYEIALALGDMLTHHRTPQKGLTATTEEAVKLNFVRSELGAVADNFKQIVSEGWDQS